jgi:hypothetical protein
MAWARLDDGFWRHPKRRRLRLASDGLLARAMSYAAERSNAAGDTPLDGFIEDAWVAEQFRRRDRRLRREIVGEMVRERILEPVSGGEIHELEGPPSPTIRSDPVNLIVGPFPEPGYLIHDFLHYHRTTEEVAEDRDQEAKRKRHTRLKGRQQVLPWSSPEAAV